MTFSVVIPTKNRPTELATVIDSLLAQTHLPDQMIIIDQSSLDKVIREKVIMLANEKGVDLDYIHDETITGLVQAKAASIGYNRCDYISFFDDDIVLKKNYFEVINFTLNKNPSIVGLNGKILNYPKVSLLKRIIFKSTHFGLFKDNRILNQLKPSNSANLIKLNVLSGGLSTWKRSVFDKVQFDIFNKLYAYEDQEFSIRVKKYISKELYLATEAELYHNHSEVNRTSLVKKYRGDILEVFLIYKKNRDIKFARISLVVLIVGLLFNAIFLCFSLKKVEVLKNYFVGLLEGIKCEPRDE